jgi:hypothetical protein
MNPAAYNPRKDLKPTDPEYQKLAHSMGQFGYVEPVIWNERTGNVVGGHQRLKILIASGAEEVEVSVVNLSPTEEKALNVALNKISGEWDDEKLTELLKELSQDIDSILIGFDQDELDRMLESSILEVDEYVDGFFENGSNYQAGKNAAKDTINPAPDREQQQQETDTVQHWNITALALSNAQADALGAYLTENQMEYRREAVA